MILVLGSIHCWLIGKQSIISRKLFLVNMERCYAVHLSESLFAACIVLLLFTIVTAQIDPTGYPSRIPGTCGSSMKFDCGNGTCIDVSKVRNCRKDCNDGSDEQCGTNQTLCDTQRDPCGQNAGCGKCVPKELANIQCLDRIYNRNCEIGKPTFKCKATVNCVINDWILDGINDCGDWSDEDMCLTRNTPKANCSQVAICQVDRCNDVFVCRCPTGYVGNGTVCEATTTTATTSTSTKTTLTPTATTTSSTSSPTASTATTTTASMTSSSTKSTTSPTTSPLRCPDGWLRLNSKCFKLFDAPLGFFGGQETCKANNATLISIHDASTNQQASELASRQQSTWIGLVCVDIVNYQSNRAWIWSDGTPIDYTKWRTGISANRYACATMNSDGFWEPQMCEATLPCLCQQPAT